MTFNIDEWLVGGRDTRYSKNVWVYRDSSKLTEAHEILRELETMEKKPADKEAAISDTSDTAQLREKANQLLAELKQQRIKINIVGLIRSEQIRIRKAVEADGFTSEDPEFDYAMLAEAATFPDGSQLPAEKWPAFHQTIGEPQFQSLLQALVETPRYMPEVNPDF